MFSFVFALLPNDIVAFQRLRADLSHVEECILDISIVNIAIPSIQREMEVDPSSLQWVLTAYVLTSGGFLLVGGRLGDLLRRRRVLLAGLVLFTAASALGGWSVNAGMLFRWDLPWWVWRRSGCWGAPQRREQLVPSEQVRPSPTASRAARQAHGSTLVWFLRSCLTGLRRSPFGDFPDRQRFQSAAVPGARSGLPPSLRPVKIVSRRNFTAWVYAPLSLKLRWVKVDPKWTHGVAVCAGTAVVPVHGHGDGYAGADTHAI